MATLKFFVLISIVSHGTAVARVIDARTARDGLSAEDNCKDCTEILELFAGMISDNGTQVMVIDILEEVCHQLPGTMTQDLCLEEVKQILPVVIQFLTDFIKTNQICTILGVCKSQSQGMELEVLTNYITEIYTLPGPGTMTETPSYLQCSLCLFFFKGLDILIPKMKCIVVQLLVQLCRILPGRLSDSCQGFVERNVQQALEFLLSWLTPRKVCHLLRFCTSQDLLSADCSSCRMLVMLGRLHLGFNATELQTSAFLESVCRLYPSFIPKCESFTQRYGPKLQKALTRPAGIQDQCESVSFCQKIRR